jgi:PAS domain S-box-containing protein
MLTPLRVLMVEDSEDDALLILRDLKKGGYNPRYERVETAAAMKKALQEKQWDVILCDYKLPKFNVPSVIGVFKKTNIDIPIIIVSGAIGEETAVECMRLGAHDYIMKNNLSRLVPAIERELKEAESRVQRKRAEETLGESEKKYRDLYDFLPIPVYEMDLEANIISVNRAIYEIFRGTEEDLKKGFKVWQILSPEEIDKVAKNMQRLLKGEQIAGTEYILTRLDGSVFPAIVISSVIYSDGKPVGLRGAIIDITERKQAEESLRKSEEKYRNIIENMQEGYFENDLAGNFTFVNDAECRNIGYSKEELIGMNNRQYQDETNAQKAYQLFGRLYRTGEPAKALDVEIIRKNGAKGFNEVSASLIRDAEGKPIGFRGISRDITERKQAEEELKESENKYRLLADNVNDVIFVLDMNLNYTYISPSVKILRGYEPAEVLKKPTIETLTPSSWDLAMRNVSEVMELEKSGRKDIPISRTLQLEMVRKNGTTVWTEVEFSFIRDEDQRPVGILGVARDITERKQAEAALRESEENFRCSLEDSPLGIRIATAKGETLYANQAALEIYGYDSIEELERTPLAERYTPESYADFQIRKEKRGRGEFGPSEYDISIMRKNGKIRHVQVFRKGVIWNGAKQFQIIYHDITDRKQAEEALRKSEHLHRIITNNIRDTVSLLDINFRATWINPSVTKTIGFTLDELAQVPLDRQLTPDSMQRVQDLMLKHLTAENLADKNKELNATGEFEFYRKNGDIFWNEINISLLRDADGKPTGFLTVGRDITERKRAEEERQQSFERMRKALGATVHSISVIVEMKDPYTSGHQQRVSDLARSIATEMGLSADRQDFIRTASAIHDIGKIAIPSEILSKPTKLTDLEFSLIKTHAQSGYDILKDIEFPWPVADVVLQHHERMDGSGYPQGLKGDDILLEARIIAVADVVEAIASHRPYRASLGIDLALEEISRNKGILYDADAVDACLKLFREKGYTLVLKKS